MQKRSNKFADQIAAWSKAIMILDGSEVLLRDVIEKNLADVLRTGYPIPVRHIGAVLDDLRDKILKIRTAAVKRAFRSLGDKRPIGGKSLSSWAIALLRSDVAIIDSTIRSGLIAGLAPTEIARTVIGSMGLNGVDGVTEFTRHKIAHLGRLAIKEREPA